jgi:AcrR family transcriptional regulator
MTRWQPDAQGRLQEAALALFEERGFDDTTVADIAARAGLTKRTFFRYFTDKREVLFDSSGAFEQRFVDGIEQAPASATALDAVAAGIDAVAGFLEGRRDVAPRRQAILDANAELQERERTKLAAAAAAGSEALHRRGVTEPAATLAADVGIAVLRVAFARWIDGGAAEDLRELSRDSFGVMRTVAASDVDATSNAPPR